MDQDQEFVDTDAAQKSLIDRHHKARAKTSANTPSTSEGENRHTRARMSRRQMEEVMERLTPPSGIAKLSQIAEAKKKFREDPGGAYRPAAPRSKPHPFPYKVRPLSAGDSAPPKFMMLPDELQRAIEGCVQRPSDADTRPETTSADSENANESMKAKKASAKQKMVNFKEAHTVVVMPVDSPAAVGPSPIFQSRKATVRLAPGTMVGIESSPRNRPASSAAKALTQKPPQTGSKADNETKQKASRPRSATSTCSGGSKEQPPVHPPRLPRPSSASPYSAPIVVHSSSSAASSTSLRPKSASHLSKCSGDMTSTPEKAKGLERRKKDKANMKHSKQLDKEKCNDQEHEKKEKGKKQLEEGIEKETQEDADTDDEEDDGILEDEGADEFDMDVGLMKFRLNVDPAVPIGRPKSASHIKKGGPGGLVGDEFSPPPAPRTRPNSARGRSTSAERVKRPMSAQHLLLPSQRLVYGATFGASIRPISAPVRSRRRQNNNSENDADAGDSTARTLGLDPEAVPRSTSRPQSARSDVVSAQFDWPGGKADKAERREKRLGHNQELAQWRKGKHVARFLEDLNERQEQQLAGTKKLLKKEINWMLEHRQKQKQRLRNLKAEDSEYVDHLLRWFSAVKIQRAWYSYQTRTFMLCHLDAVERLRKWRGPDGFLRKRAAFVAYRDSFLNGLTGEIVKI